MIQRRSAVNVFFYQPVYVLTTFEINIAHDSIFFDKAAVG